MKRAHTLFIALMLGAAAAAGLLAATRTADIGQAASPKPASAQALAARAAKLDRMERSLQKALAKRPPKLPKVPHPHHASLAGVASQSAQGGVVYVRPPATVSSPSSSEDNDSFENEHEVGDD
jgi:hypothetical protein